MPCITLSSGKNVCYDDQANRSSFNNGGIAKNGIVNRIREKFNNKPADQPITQQVETTSPSGVYTFPGVNIERQSDTKEGGYNYSGSVQGGTEGLANLNNLSSLEMRKMGNMYGKPWQIGNNMFATPTDAQHLKKDDVVLFSRPTTLKDKLKGIPSKDQHFGYVDGVDVDGTPIIRHYEGNRYYTERLPDVGKGTNTQYTFSKGFTPDEFRPVTYSTNNLQLDSGYSPNQIEEGVIAAANKDHEDYQNTLNLTDKEFDQINKLAFGLIGAESNFGRSKKTLYRMAAPKSLQKAIKSGMDLFGYGSGYDPNLNTLSEGYASTKESGQFNFSPMDQEEFDKRHLLTGIKDPVKLDKMRREAMNKDIKEGRFKDYDKNTNYLYHAFNSLGIDPNKLDDPESSYKAALATLAFYKQLNPNATDEDLMKKYTGKRNVKKYSEEVKRHLNKIDGLNDNNPENSFTDDLYGTLSIGANKLSSIVDNVKQAGAGFLRDFLPGPANLKALAADAVGSKTPITERTFSQSNLDKLGDIVVNTLANNRNNISYDDYSGGADAYSDVGGGSSPGFVKGLTDDAYILKTLLGQARVKDLGNGYYEIQDTYDFNDAGKSFGVRDDLNKRGFSGYNLARSIGRNYGSRDKMGAPVKVKVYIPDFEQKLAEKKKAIAEQKSGKQKQNKNFSDNLTGQIERVGKDRMGLPLTFAEQVRQDQNNRSATPTANVVRPQPRPVTSPTQNRPVVISNNERPSMPEGMGLIDTMGALGYNDTSKEARKKLASAYGIKNYDFSAEKNTELRNILLSESIRKEMGDPDQQIPYSLLRENNTFAVGGPVYPPAYTTDPRKVQMYNDSLNLFNKANAIRQANNNRVRTAINNNNANNSFWQSDLDAPISKMNPYEHHMGRIYTEFPNELIHDEIDPTKMEYYYSPDIGQYDEFGKVSKYGVDNYLFDRPKQPYILSSKSKETKKPASKQTSSSSKPNPKSTTQSQRKPLESLEYLQSREVPRLTPNFEMEPRSIDVPFIPQSSNEEVNKEYSLRIPTIDINKRQVAPRANRILGNNIVNPKNQYQRSIDFGSREIPIANDYQLNNLMMKVGMEPRFENGGFILNQAVGGMNMPSEDYNDKPNEQYIKRNSKGEITQIDIRKAFNLEDSQKDFSKEYVEKALQLQNNQGTQIQFCVNGKGCAEFARKAANAYRDSDWVPNNEFNSGHAWMLGNNNSIDKIFPPYTQQLFDSPAILSDDLFNAAYKKSGPTIRDLSNYSDRIILLDRLNNKEATDSKGNPTATYLAAPGTGNEHAGYMLPDGKFLLHGTGGDDHSESWRKDHLNRNGFFVLDKISDGKIELRDINNTLKYVPTAAVDDR